MSYYNNPNYGKRTNFASQSRDNSSPRSMGSSWRRAEPSPSEMSASAWRNAPEHIREQDQALFAEQQAARQAYSSHENRVAASTNVVYVSRSTEEPRHSKPPARRDTTSIYVNQNYYVDLNKPYLSIEDINVFDVPPTDNFSEKLLISPINETELWQRSSGLTPPTSANLDNESTKPRFSRPKKTNDSKTTRNLNESWRASGAPIFQPIWHMSQRQQEGSFPTNPDDQHRKNQPLRFKYFLERKEVMQMIEKGEAYQGPLRINGRRRADAYVTADNLDADIYIGGTIARNRALEGDIVVVRLLDVNEVWKQRTKRQHDYQAKRNQQQNQTPERSVEPTLTEDINNTEDNDTAVYVGTLAEDDSSYVKEVTTNEQDVTEDNMDAKPKYAGEVVYIVDRDEDRSFTGILSIDRPNMPARRQEHKQKVNVDYVWFKPTDKRTPLMQIYLENAPQDILSNPEIYEKELMMVSFLRWPISSLFPHGRAIRSLGPVGDLYAEEQAILTDNNIYDEPFDELVMDHLATLPLTIPQAEYSKRRDLREELVFTIDPDTAKDLDDALHIKKLNDDLYEVGVHIADVSYYVKQDTLLDAEAKKRSTTAYLVNRTVPMLPALLSENVCSLSPLKDKLTFSVIWKMDKDANIIETWFGRTVIRSHAKLNYDDAQLVIEGGSIPTKVMIMNYGRQQLAESIMNLFHLSQIMRSRRYDNGALSMNSVKLNFDFDANHQPNGVNIFQAKEANKLVEEFMLRANISVARKIYAAYPELALLRRHELPIARRLEKFVDLVRELGYEMNGESAGGLQASFEGLKDERVKEVFLVLAIQCMKRAKYFCSGYLDTEKYLHYALNQDFYTHFTSPIRRYPDIIVHRLLEAALLEKEVCAYDKREIQKIAVQCNRKKDGAKNAQESDIMLYLAKYLALLSDGGDPLIEEATVIKVERSRFEIYLAKYGLVYRVYAGGLPLSQYKYIDKEERLDLYWKPGVQVNKDYFNQTRDKKWDDTQNDDEDEDDNSEGKTINDEKKGDVNELADSLAEAALTDATEGHPRRIHSTSLDAEGAIQSVDLLSTLKVTLIPEVSNTPPRIHVVPLNPF